MKSRLSCLILAAALAPGCAHDGTTRDYVDRGDYEATSYEAGRMAKRASTIEDFQRAAMRNRSVLEMPTFETTPGQLIASVDEALGDADKRLADLGRQNTRTARFSSTVKKMDDILYPVVATTNRLDLIQESSMNEAMRETAAEQGVRLRKWFVDLEYNEDVYKAVKAFDDMHKRGQRPPLQGEDLKLLEDTMRDYRQAGMHLNKDTRDRVQEMQKELSELTTRFSQNITNASKTLTFTREELQGVPESFLERVQVSDGVYDVHPNVTGEFVSIMRNADHEDIRRKMKTERYSLAMDENTGLLDEIVRMRDEIARTLGYNSWADYRIEPKMAKDAATARAFVTNLVQGLEPKFRTEIEAMREYKVADTGDAGTQINVWDWRYYRNKLMEEKYAVDTEELRNFFRLEPTLAGMFEIYEEIFGLKFHKVDAPYVWAPGVDFYVTADAETGEPLGAFYLDLFPREGKYNHFAQFGILDGKLREDGRYQRPVVALVCNFTPASGNTPSLLTHDEVETLFHEFGHAMHSIMTTAKYVKFSGTSVPRDFVEAPSQMLEAWVWDVDVLNRFASDWRDSSRKIDPGLIEKMKAAKLATIGTFYRRQLSFAMGDLQLHGPGEYKNSEETFNRTLGEVFFPSPDGTHFAAYFGHLMGYDAGYYGYAWADSIAADMATAFEQSRNRFMDKNTGMRLRNEIYAVGGSRNVNESIRVFLGRERSMEPFLKSLGIGN